MPRPGWFKQRFVSAPMAMSFASMTDSGGGIAPRASVSRSRPASSSERAELLPVRASSPSSREMSDGQDEPSRRFTDAANRDAGTERHALRAVKCPGLETHDARLRCCSDRLGDRGLVRGDNDIAPASASADEASWAAASVAVPASADEPS